MFLSFFKESASFFDYVQDCEADIFAITETWLTQNDAVVCMDCSTVLVQTAYINSPLVKFSEASSFQFRLVIVFRIPYSAFTLSFQAPSFWNSVTTYIRYCYPRFYFVSGGVDSAKFADLLELMSLIQHVRSPTHIEGEVCGLGNYS